MCLYSFIHFYLARESINCCTGSICLVVVVVVVVVAVAAVVAVMVVHVVVH
jgi:hypothetical protein